MAPDGLATIPPFSLLGPADSRAVLDRFESVPARAGDTIVTEGEDGSCMFVIADGTFRVERRARDGTARHVDDMAEGEFFGEMSLLSGAPRFASVVAGTDGRLLRLDRLALDALVGASPGIGQTLSTFYKRRLVENVVRASPLFQLIAAGRADTFAEIVRVETRAGGTVLVEQGQPGREFFLLLRGACDVFHLASDGRELPYPALQEGDVFGELSLLQDQKTTATVRARTRCVVLAMGRSWFDELILSNQSVRTEIYALAGQRSQRTRELLVREALEGRLV
jgi:cAMP-dependent protein kinase regulator